MDCKVMFVFTIVTCHLKFVVAQNITINMESKIYRRHEANIKKFPYAVFLLVSCKGGPYVCGASIVNQIIILTAAHCLKPCSPRNPHLVQAHLGNARPQKGLILELADFKLHEKYDEVKVANDIAIAKLEKPVKLGASMSRVSIILYPSYDASATVCRWGSDEDDEDSEILLFARQEVWSRRRCERELKTIPPNTFCAAPPEGKHGHATPGDSGGALVVHDYIQIGLVSYRKPKVNKKLVVYTDVGKYIKWIKHNAKQMYCNNSPS